MNKHETHRFTHRLGMSLSELLVLLAIIAALVAIALPVLAMSSDTAGIAGSKRNLQQLAVAHQMYAADHDGNQWVNVAHDVATFGYTYNQALNNWIDSLGGCSHPQVAGPNCEWQTFLGWGTDPLSGAVGLWRYPWNLYTMPIHLDNTVGPYKGFGHFRMHNVKPFTEYLSGRTYDPVFFAPKHQVALDALGECHDDEFEYCVGEGNEGHVYWPSYSRSPAALFHPDMWTEPQDEFVNSMNEIFARYPHAFQALPYTAAKYPDLKTHVMEHVWLQNVDPAAGDCNEALPTTFGSYDSCTSWFFNASINSSPVTLFYDGHVRLLPLTEVKQADDKIGVWRRDTPMGPWASLRNCLFDGVPAQPPHPHQRRHLRPRYAWTAGAR
jgi:type II secretory pathway pseudopilin PulG